MEVVAVAAPWVAAWDSQAPADSVINDALWLADLEPVNLSAISESYLGEINTMLVCEERGLCKNTRVQVTRYW